MLSNSIFSAHLQGMNCTSDGKPLNSDVFRSCGLYFDLESWIFAAFLHGQWTYNVISYEAAKAYSSLREDVPDRRLIFVNSKACTKYISKAVRVILRGTWIERTIVWRGLRVDGVSSYSTSRKYVLTPFMRASAYFIILSPPLSFNPTAPNCHGMILAHAGQSLLRFDA